VSRAGLEDTTVGDDFLFEDKGLHTLTRDQSGVLYLGTEQGVFRSADGGVNWRHISGPPWAQESVRELMVTHAWPVVRLWVTAASGVYLYTPEGP